MQPVRKKFESERSLFPFHLVYKESKSPQHELPTHVHEWYEIVIIYKGEGVFFIDQTFYEIRAGDIIIIPSNTIHHAIPEESNLITSTAIFFSPNLIQQATFGETSTYLTIFQEAKTTKNYKYSLKPVHLSKLNEYVDCLFNEELAKKQGRENAILLWLHLILLELYRNRLQHDSLYESQSRFGPKWVTDILLFINQNVNNRLDLTYLAKQVSVSPAHFSRTFKQLIGMNISDYLTEKRINLAKDKLKNDNDKILTIANQCGFTSMPHFYRTFKKQTGMTPTEYRRNL